MEYTEMDHTFVVCAYKESEYIDECIQSLINQRRRSQIMITTSTPNDKIISEAVENDIPLHINERSFGIGNDWNYALECAGTSLVTIAHQDDIYNVEYTSEMLDTMNRCQSKPQIFFSNYGEIRGKDRIEDNRLLRVKRKLLKRVAKKHYASSRFDKRNLIRLGSAICCPSVTYNKDCIPIGLFSSNLRCNLDWEAWERLSNIKGSFCYSPKILMYHRIHDESETSHLIRNNTRTEEDFLMLCKFWPKPIARIINSVYVQSEKSNEL